MSRRLRCRRGHEWDPADDTPFDEESCPTCGGRPVSRARGGEGGSLLKVLCLALGIPLVLALLAGGALVYIWWDHLALVAEMPRVENPRVNGFGPNGFNGGPSAVLADHPGDVTALAFTSNDTLAVGTGQSDPTGKNWTGQVKLWDLRTGEGRLAAGEQHGIIRGLAATPDGKTLASAGAGGTIQLWDMPAGKGRRLLGLRGQEPKCVAVSADGTAVAMGDGGGTDNGVLTPGEILLWDVAADKERARLKGHAGSVNHLAFSPDGRTLASTSADRTVRLWDALTGKELAKLRAHHDEVNGVAFSPDGTQLATGGSDGRLILWDLATKAPEDLLLGAQGPVTGVAFTPDGRRLVAGTGVAGAFGEVRVWNVQGRRLALVFRGQTNLVSYLAVSPDGRKIASASAGRGESVCVWDLPPAR